jgi:hypothetical protein
VFSAPDRGPHDAPGATGPQLTSSRALDAQRHAPRRVAVEPRRLQVMAGDSRPSPRCSPRPRTARVAIYGYDPPQHEAVHSLIREFVDIAPQVHASDDFDDSLAWITATVVHAVGGCESASINLIIQAGPVTRGETDSLGR